MGAFYPGMSVKIVPKKGHETFFTSRNLTAVEETTYF